MSLTWRAVLSRSEELLLSFIEHAVVSTDYDDVLRSQMKNRKDVENLFSAVPLNSLIADTDEALTGEAAGGGAPDDDDGADGGQGVGEDQ